MLAVVGAVHTGFNLQQFGRYQLILEDRRRIESFQRLSAVVVGSQLIKPGPDLQCPDLTLCTLHPLAILLYNEPGRPLYMMAPTERFGVGGYVSPEPTLRSQDRFKRCASAWGYFPAPALLHRLILVSE